jgi:DNA-binding PadR family transcriptional regulator
MARPTLQHFELQVLLAILRLGGEAYSVPLVLELEKRAARAVAPAAVFIALSRLEKKGCLTSRLDDRGVAETGRVRRYFKPTRQGLKLIREARLTHARLWQGLDRVLRSDKT